MIQPHPLSILMKVNSNFAAPILSSGSLCTWKTWCLADTKVCGLWLREVILFIWWLNGGNRSWYQWWTGWRVWRLCGSYVATAAIYACSYQQKEKSYRSLCQKRMFKTEGSKGSCKPYLQMFLLHAGCFAPTSLYCLLALGEKKPRHSLVDNSARTSWWRQKGLVHWRTLFFLPLLLSNWLTLLTNSCRTPCLQGGMVPHDGHWCQTPLEVQKHHLWKRYEIFW